jgi:hypothetical protein
MGTAPGGSTLPGGSTWGPAAGSRQKNIQARGRAGCLRHTSARTVLEGCPAGRRAFVAGAGPAEPSISTYVRPRDGGRRPGGQESGHQLRHRSSSRDDAGSY